jgi:hypothetical protein
VFTSISGGRLQNPSTKLCLAVHDGNTTPGTTVLLATCSAAAAQRWRLPG